MRNLIDTLKKDIKANSGNYEVCLFLAFFRLGSYFKFKTSQGGINLLFFPIKLMSHIIYKILSTIYGMEIPLGTSIGPGLTLYHLKGIVVNSEAIIGKKVVINHYVTISEGVIISNNVVINTLSVIVKGEIGENSVVGAGSVVTKNVKQNTIVAGCPAKVIKTN